MKHPVLSSMVLGLLLAASAEAADRKIVVLQTMPVPVVEAHRDSIVRALDRLEHKRGEEFEVQILKAEGSHQQAMELLADSMESGTPDLVITVATLATQAAKEVLSGTKIPIVFCVVADPVGSEILDRLGGATGTNISGVVLTQLREVKLEMAMRLLQGSRYASSVRFGVVCSDYPSGIGDLNALREIAAGLKRAEFVSYHFPYRPVPDGLPAMYADLRRGVQLLVDDVDFFWEVSSPLSELEEGTRILLESGKGLIFGNSPASVRLGALMAVFADHGNTGTRIADMAHKIFDGADVGTLPVVIPGEFNLYLNLKTARNLDLRVPSHLLMIAGDNLIE